MCVTFLLLDSHPDLRFLLAFNRDEYLERPTQPAHWWPDQPNLLASKDLKGGGTWLGLTREGRFALVTNVREVDHDKVTNAASRGALPIAFLTGKQIPMAFLGSIQLQAYNGFNMVVGDLSTKQAAYVTNRGTNTQPVQLQPGLHGISNGSGPQQEWFKDRSSITDDSQLPATGMPQQMERMLSPIFIKTHTMLGVPYGTRTQTMIAAWHDGHVAMRERNLASNGAWVQAEHMFRLPLT
ncbi:hypothetical protein WJX84_012400 [Apatococcus fuscideae]|uniref:NRDE family protein n=1 Tax=Apatococcus fuscideae TaxID=2026836 RepID=A0AAW1T787_9CHLO